MTEDIIERLSHLHVWPQSIASTYADTLTPRQIERLYDVGNVATDAANEIASLRKQLEDAREAIIEANNSLYGSQGYFLSLDGGPPNKYHLAEGIERLKSNAKALRSLPTDDGWEDMALDKLDAWRFNVMLECQGGNGKCVVGGAELDLNDLLAILDFVSDQRPLPAPPAC